MWEVDEIGKGIKFQKQLINVIHGFPKVAGYQKAMHRKCNIAQFCMPCSLATDNTVQQLIKNFRLYSLGYTMTSSYIWVPRSVFSLEYK